MDPDEFPEHVRAYMNAVARLGEVDPDDPAAWDAALAELEQARPPRGATVVPPAFHAAADPAVDLAEFIRMCDPDPAAIVSDGKNLAFPAAAAGQLEKLRWLVEHGVDPDHRDPHGYSPLVAATNWSWTDPGNLPVIDYLISLGVDLDAASAWKESGLRNSLLAGNYTVARRLIEAGASADPCRFTVLHQAAAWGSADDLARAIAGAGLEIRDTWDRTPWLVAVHAGRLDAAKLLRQAGAATDVTGRDGHNALGLAASAGHPHLVRELLGQGFDANWSNDSKETALHAAAARGAVDTAAILIAAGADVHARAEFGSTPLNSACSLAMLELLHRHGADLDTIDKCGEWPLKGFAESGDLQAVRWLLDHGATVDRTSTGATALHEAILRDQLPVAALLLDRGADANQPDVDMQTPLFYAKTVAAAALLLGRGADPDFTDQCDCRADDWDLMPDEVRAFIREFRARQ